MGKAKHGEKGKGRAAYMHRGGWLELWLAEEPGARGKGAELGYLSTNSCHSLFTDLSCSQGTCVSLHWLPPCGRRVVRGSTLQASRSQHVVPCKHRDWWNSHEGPSATWDMPLCLWPGRKVTYACTHMRTIAYEGMWHEMPGADWDGCGRRAPYLLLCQGG